MRNYSKNKSFLYRNILFLFFITTGLLIAQSNVANHSVFIISNTVDISNYEAFKSNINEVLSEQTEPFTVIINGDLVDSKFDKNFDEDSLRIRNLLNGLSEFENRKIFIVPVIEIGMNPVKKD